MQARRLTEDGIDRFEDFLQRLKENPTSRLPSHALTDDRRRLVELIFARVSSVDGLSAQHDLRAALQIEGELRSPRALLEAVHPDRIDAEECRRHQQQAQEDPPGMTNRRG